MIDESSLRKALEEFQPDIVLCDYAIPGYSGPAAIELISQLSPQIPVVLLSGVLGEGAAIRHLRCGVSDYILKSNLQRLGPAVSRAIAYAEAQARASEAEQSRNRLAEVLDASQEIIIISDPQGRVTFVNHAACRLLRQSAQQILGTAWMQRVRGDPTLSTPNEILSCALQQGRWQGEVRFMTGEGLEIPVSQIVTAHFGSGNEARCISTIAQDLSDQKLLESRIQTLLTYDPLTGLRNFCGMKSVFEDARVHSPDTLLTISVLNLDEFHLVDEALGRSTSDELIIDVAASLRTAVGTEIVVGRVGADEFMLLAPKGRSAAARRLDGVLEAVSAARILGGREVYITASAGIAEYPANGADLETLHRKARAAVRVSKARGPGLWLHHARGTERKAKQRLLLESGLRGALQRQEISLVYQPQYATDSGVACGVEALVRWSRTDGEIVAPSVFVPLAEQINLISPIGAWVLTEACSTVSGWNRETGSANVVSVNVSARQIKPDFCHDVYTILTSTGLDPHHLELEITESIMIDHAQETLAQLTRLRASGIKIAVDDFGTGFSGLSYLARLPMDRLKIDKSLIQGLNAARNVAIVQAVIELGSKCDFAVIAEGVETQEQLHLLTGLGCRQVQGYLFSRPVRALEARELMSRRWGAASGLLSGNHAMLSGVYGN